MNVANSVNLFMEIILVVFGIPGNLMIIVVSCLYARKSTTDLLIGVQAVIDLLAAIPAFYSIVMLTGPDHVNDSFCKVKAFSLRYVRYTSLFLMAAIALDRFRVVCHALDQRWSWKTLHIIILVTLCNLLGIAISFPNALVTVPHNLVNGVRCVRSVNQFPFFDEIYPIVTTALFFAALFVTGALYLKVVRVIRKQNRIRATMTAPPSSRIANTTAADEYSDNSTLTHNGVQEISTVSGRKSVQEGSEVLRTAEVPERRPLRLVLRNPWTANQDEQPSDLQSANQPPAGDQSTSEGRQHNGLLQPGTKRASSPRHTKQRKKTTPSLSGGGKERQTTAMLLVITIIFFVSWIPGVITTHIPSPALRVFRKSVVNNLLVIVGYALRNINHIVNVFIYTLMSRRFKHQSTQVIRRLLRRR
ncbi:uncharacterized protein LOC121427270 [Lytechinus variegatus]|uniref:uncharacterized protein LOC121427270 n=1 Tax=Lytechinus variegatus TaxID=7654 RepID=UPI001BB24D79|nr:uncharacterized protein LOC121427270 [Lytechinus variegatus]